MWEDDKSCLREMCSADGHQSTSATQADSLEIFVVVWVLYDIVPAVNQRLAQPAEHQQEEGILFLITEHRDALPACQHCSAYIQRIGVLQHHVGRVKTVQTDKG
ncbi:hypothetical protein EYF80_014202 [Liparis tanakae]|uniref:Uncharacterized protein n=1 Tax=Liparis tanakae TaxID=230148 RepID=A0A4Z2IC33_9TELE|nr:hypothetical protein EYF80_014202 [Liparis tanakae]